MECRGSDGTRSTAFAAVCLGALSGAAPLPARERSGECTSTAASTSSRVPTGSLPRFPGQWGRRPGGRSHASSNSSSSGWRRGLGRSGAGLGAGGAFFVRPSFKSYAAACQASGCIERCQHLAGRKFQADSKVNLRVQFGSGGTAQAAWLWPFSLVGRGAASTAQAEEWIGSSLSGCWLQPRKSLVTLQAVLIYEWSGLYMLTRWGPLVQESLHAGIAANLTAPACVVVQQCLTSTDKARTCSCTTQNIHVRCVHGGICEACVCKRRTAEESGGRGAQARHGANERHGRRPPGERGGAQGGLPETVWR